MTTVRVGVGGRALSVTAITDLFQPNGFFLSNILPSFRLSTHFPPISSEKVERVPSIISDR